VRVAILLLLLALAVAARAEDDDGTLDQAPLGPGIPERMQELEKEWADDVGADPSDEPKAEPEDDAAEPAGAGHDDEHEAPSKPRLPEQLVPKASKPSALTRPPRDGGGERRDAAKPKAPPAEPSSPTKPANPAPARTDAHATGED
jgi:hypothetical protein